MIRHWIEAIRLRTLPVSVAGVIAGTGCAILSGSFKAIPALLCLAFAILAQIAANVLVVNNYRDMEDDAAVGKHTTVVIFGRKAISVAYLLSGFIGMSEMTPVWLAIPVWALAVPLIYLALHIKTWHNLRQSDGSAINPLLGRTAMNLLILALLFAAACLLI